MITGELSGDYLGAWYLEKMKPHHTNEIHVIGGPLLHRKATHIIADRQDIAHTAQNALEFAKHYCFLDSIHYQLLEYIRTHSITNIILIDTPLITLPLATLIKKEIPDAHITYLAIPEMWLWGRWEIDSWIQKDIDTPIVLFPFEQQFYENTGLATLYIGSPHYDRVPEALRHIKKQPCIAVLPGARESQVHTMLPLFLSAVTPLLDEHQELSVRCFIPHHIYNDQQTQSIIQLYAHARIEYQTDTTKTLECIAPCCAALTKPGTATLELTLLDIPFILGFKCNPLIYFFLALLFQRDAISLPNLLLQHKAFPEHLQVDCTPEKLYIEISHLYHAWQENTDHYREQVQYCKQVQEVLNKKGKICCDLASQTQR